MTDHSRLWLLAIVLTAAVAPGCGIDLSPAPIDAMTRQADAANLNDAALSARLLASFDAAGPEAAIARLSDANEAVAVAAARSLGRWSARKDPAHAARALDALADAQVVEIRPAVRIAQIDATVSLLANRGGLPTLPEQTLNVAAARAMVQNAALSLANLRQPHIPDMLGEPVAGQLYDGPGWRAKPPTARPAKPIAPYPESLHTVPVIAPGRLLLGDLNGDSAPDYLVLDNAGRADWLQVRLTVYDHYNQMVWSQTLVGDDRPGPSAMPILADLDGDGPAEIVYLDQAGRVVIRDGGGTVRRRSPPMRTLAGDACDGGAQLILTNLRGGGLFDLVLACNSDVQAMTEQFLPLWHISLTPFSGGVPPLRTSDLDGDGRDEIVYDATCIGHDGRVRWSALAAAGDTAITELANRPGRRVAAIVTVDGQLFLFDADGLLWDRPAPKHGRLLVGRFSANLPGRLISPVGPTSGDDLPPGGVLFDGLGSSSATPRPPRAEIFSPTAPLVCDWNGDGLDEVWGRSSQGDPLAGWRRWPGGQPVANFAMADEPEGLFDVDNDGRDELLYFQGKSLVILRRP